MSGSPHRGRLLLTPLVSLVVALGAAILPATSAQAAASDTSVSIEIRRTVSSKPAPDGALFGVFHDSVGPAIPWDTFVITGRLTEDAGGTGLAGQEVFLDRSRLTQDTYSQVGTAEPVVTDADGYFEFPQRVVGTAWYVVAYDGDGVTYNGSDSTEGADPAFVYAQRDFNEGTRKVSGRLYYRGDINPGWGGRTVKLRKKTCSSCAWKTVATATASSTGGWSFRVYYPGRVGPVWRWEAVIAAAGDFDRSFTVVLRTWLSATRALARSG